MKYDSLIVDAENVTGGFTLSNEWRTAGTCGAALLASNGKGCL